MKNTREEVVCSENQNSFVISLELIATCFVPGKSEFRAALTPLQVLYLL